MKWPNIFRGKKAEVKPTRGLRVLDKIRKPKQLVYEADVLICYYGKPVSKMKVIENGFSSKNASDMITERLSFRIEKIHQKK